MVGAAENISDFKGMGLDVIVDYADFTPIHAASEVLASLELMRQGGPAFWASRLFQVRENLGGLSRFGGLPACYPTA